MYERMLDKNYRPTMAEMYAIMGESAVTHWKLLEEFFRNSYDIMEDIRFPFGNHYGWGSRFNHKSKTLCYMFPEKGAFTVFFQIGKNEVGKMLDKLESFLPQTREVWENRYPCGEGGWLHYRVLNNQEVDDIKELMKMKKKPAR